MGRKAAFKCRGDIGLMGELRPDPSLSLNLLHREQAINRRADIC